MIAGTVLGHYRIISPLGKGGMGEVYAAEDTKLHRTVALKILPPSMGADPERRKRFEREAQAVAALNHPNIVTIYSVEEAGGVVFLTMEAIDGRTLKETLESGAMPIDAVLRVAIAVSDAMAAAHQRGITHRDLKPANVMVTPDGRVKVLDFGLAKLSDMERDRAGELPTGLKGDDLTGEGRIIGTVAYMSPEQAEGKSVDPRSDVFSFGVMLHEMASGERPFKGETDISVISSILKETPSSITDIKPDLPADLARIVRRCLAKDPARRYQIATDLRNDLEELKQDLDSGVRPAPVTPSSARPAPASGRRRKAWIAAGGLAVMAGAAGLFFWQTRRPPATFTAERVTRLTESGTAGLAALSRDGRYVVHVKTESGLKSLWVRQTRTPSDVQIVPPAVVRYDGLTFSPDGNYVHYVSYLRGSGLGSLYRIPTLGGAPSRVLENVDSGIAFSPDGRNFAFARGTRENIAQLMIAAADGSGGRIVASLDKTQYGLETPAWSPDGHTILMIFRDNRTRSGILAVDAETGVIKTVGQTWAAVKNVAWMRDGRSFISDGTDSEDTPTSQLWQVMYPSGERRRVTNDLDGYTGVSLSEDGTTLATVQSTRHSSLWVLAPGASEAKEIGLRASRGPGLLGLDWTPDGRLVFAAQIGGKRHIWIAAADGSGAREVTSGEPGDAFPRVSPDGRWIYYTLRGEPNRIARIGIDGSDQRTLTETRNTLWALSPDGRWMYFSAQNRLLRMPTDGGDPVPVGDDQPFAVLDVSPDGKTLLGVTFNAAKLRSECATMPAEGGAPHLLGELEPTGGGVIPSCRWDPSGTAIIYVAFRDGQMNMFMRPLAGGEERQLTRFRDGLHIFSLARAHDGRIALSRGSTTSDVVLVSSAR